MTRPLVSAGALLQEVGVGERGQAVGGDPLSPRQQAALKLSPGQITTETLEFPLFDDGTNGDTAANDRYWEIALPERLAEFDGEYRFEAVFSICQGTRCVRREAAQSVVVDVKLDRGATRVSLEPAGQQGNRKQARLLFTPADASRVPLGPGRSDAVRVTWRGDVKLGNVRDFDGRGTYVVSVDYLPGRAAIVIGQYGRPKEGIVVPLN